MEDFLIIQGFLTNNGSFNWYMWIGLPILIFLARVCDVTLGTLRIIFLSRGKQKIAPILGFFEVLIWIAIIGQLVQNIHSIPAYFGYAAGFAAGNYLGLWMERKLALGTFIVRTIVANDDNLVETEIHEAGFGVTRVEGLGSSGPVKIVYTIVRQNSIDQVLGIIHKHHSKAFVSIEEVRSSEFGIFPKSVFLQKNTLLGRKFK
jgi:uncharacterized protein YebE (UPF0316 family)